jgi:MFS transporter, SP family, arabinose:H+ symporter
MNNRLILWSITVGLGGLLFGLDTAVISGAEKTIESLWQLDKLTHGLAMAIALYGTVVGAGLGGFPADYYGRKKTLIAIGILFFVTAIGSAYAGSVGTFMFFRFFGGIAIGASSVVAPVYISEIAPAAHRGKLGISFQLNIVAGILLAYVSNYFFQGTGNEDAWRWMLAIVGLPSVLFSILMFYTPESPRWLMVKKNDEASARKILSLVSDDVETEITDIKKSIAAEKSIKTASLFSKKYKLPLLLAFLLAFFNQASGINAIIYFAPRIFEMAGKAESAAFLQSTGIGVVNLLFTILGWSLIDRFGRKTLLIIGSLGYILSLGMIAYSFQNQQYTYIHYYIFAFIASHAVGQGAIIWVFISEIFPTNVRAAGMAFGCLTHWIFAALLTNFFPALALKYGPAPIFTFFCVMMIFQLLFAQFVMPETRGVSLEALKKKLVGE